MNETIAGIDFAGPRDESRQRRKILAVFALRTGDGSYSVRAEGLNEKLLHQVPGWAAAELASSIASADPRVSVVAADFPFSIPSELLMSANFARLVGRDTAFAAWESFHAFVKSRVQLRCPVDFSSLAPWRDSRFWVKRATDVATGAQPPLKHLYQVLFNMTLLGNALLARLEESGRFDVIPFQARGRAEIVEVYPGHVLRLLGVSAYKRNPRAAIDAVLDLLASKGIHIDLAPGIRAVCESYDSARRGGGDHDAADAFVALCVGLLRREGLAVEYLGTPGYRNVEGAIWSVDGAAVTTRSVRGVPARSHRVLGASR